MSRSIRLACCLVPTLAACLVGQGQAQQSEFHFARVIKIEIGGRTLDAELSPDEAMIVYSTRTENSREIFVAKADGSNPVQLTDNRAFDFEPCWSPDGKNIMFSSSRNGEYQIFEMRADGSDVRQLTDEPHGVRRPRYSSAGWVSWQVQHPLRGKIYPADLVITRDDEKTLVTKSTYITDYAWSPDGETICYGIPGNLVFYELRSGEQNVISLNETDARFFGHAASRITWSPDNDLIACRISFLGGRSAGLGGELSEIFGDTEVFVVDPENKTIEVIEQDEVKDHSLDWVRQRFLKKS